MTVKELLVFFENYYGEKYAGTLLDVTASYLEGYPDDFRRAAANVIIKRVSRMYGKVPGPAEIEKHMDEILDGMPKTKPLPEPKREIIDGERAESLKLLEDIKRRLKNRNTGPMNGVLSRAVNLMKRPRTETV